MSTKIKKLGVLTSGGDAPGMNAAVRSVVKTALNKGIEVVGIKQGYKGLMEGNFIKMDYCTVSRIINKGGTFLYSARCLEFKEPAGVLRAVETCKKNNIEGIVVIGGDGSFRGAADLSKNGVPCIGIPATIDNDIGMSEYTIGFDTAVNCAIEMVDRLRDTMESHDRCSVVEVMGRGAGYVALYTGISTGATAIMIPEVKTTYEDVLKNIRESQAAGKNHFVIIVAEGVGGSHELAAKIEADTGIVTRATITGHILRGGAPSADDRVKATRLGRYAVELLCEGKSNRACGINSGNLVNFDVQEALQMKKPFPMDLYNTFVETCK